MNSARRRARTFGCETNYCSLSVISFTNFDPSLEAIRREIDAIDDRLLDLVGQRFAATSRVRDTKQNEGSLSASPLRPAREAIMLRRLIETRGNLPPNLLVRLWRVILSASAQAQAPIVLHVDDAVATNLNHRLSLAEHFCGMPVQAHVRTAAALQALVSRRGDLVVVDTLSDWADGFVEAAARGVRLVGALPVLCKKTTPQLLVFGHTEPQPSGDDETVVLLPPSVVADKLQAPLWQSPSGGWTVTGLAGFLPAEQIARAIPQAIVAGRYPSSIEVSL